MTNQSYTFTCNSKVKVFKKGLHFFKSAFYKWKYPFINKTAFTYWWLSLVQFCCSVVSDSLRPHELQHARPPCPSPNPGVYSNSCPSSQWYHPAISSSVVPFSSYPQSLPASGSFPMSQLFAWGGQSTGVSTSGSVLPNEHPGLISFSKNMQKMI